MFKQFLMITKISIRIVDMDVDLSETRQNTILINNQRPSLTGMFSFPIQYSTKDHNLGQYGVFFQNMKDRCKYYEEKINVVGYSIIHNAYELVNKLRTDTYKHEKQVCQLKQCIRLLELSFGLVKKILISLDYRAVNIEEITDELQEIYVYLMKQQLHMQRMLKKRLEELFKSLTKWPRYLDELCIAIRKNVLQITLLQAQKLIHTGYQPNNPEQKERLSHIQLSQRQRSLEQSQLSQIILSERRPAIKRDQVEGRRNDQPSPYQFRRKVSVKPARLVTHPRTNQSPRLA